jgi:gliding motility-associated-like protein
MKAILLFIFSMMGILAFSQAPTYDWAKRWFAGGNVDYDMAIDSLGNLYVLGSGGTQDNFNPLDWPSIPASSQNCGAISKFDPNGTLIWVKFIVHAGGFTSGGCVPKKIFIKGGSIYYAGEFSTNSSFDFDFGSSQAIFSGSGCFLSKIDLNGTFQWVKRFGDGNTSVNDISVDFSENIIITGSYQNSITLASQTITSNGGDDIFVAKWDGNGNPQWIKGFGGNTSSIDEGNGITTSTNGDIYVIGNFQGTVDFDPNIGISSFTSNGSYDIFIQKLSSEGNLIWVKTIGGNSSDLGNNITIDSYSNIVFTGLNSGIVDFDPGTNTNNLTPTTANAFICKWDENANFIWAKSIISSSNPQGFCITSDTQNNYYITGITQGTADFNPSNSEIYNLTASGGSNTFILKLTTLGDFIWAGILNGEGSPYNYINEPYSIRVTTNSIYVSGNFKGQVDFDPSSTSSYLTSRLSNTGIPSYSPYLLKLTNCISNSSSFTISQCQPYTWSTNNTTYSASGTYTDTLVNIFGCDSIITLNLTILPTQSNSVSISQCDSYTSPLGNIYNSSGSYTETYSNVNGCDSIVTINLTITNIQNTVTVSACGNYISPLGNNYNSSGTYQETYTTSNGCDSLVTIQLTINNSTTVNETKSACTSYLSPSGNTYTQSGQYYDTLITSLGCDSIIITQLTILTPTQASISPVVCSSYTSPSGIVYNQTGTYIDTLQNLNGCDSIITINLSVVGTLNVNAGPDITICSGESITLNGAGASTYSWSNGVSNNIPFSPTVTTNYEVIGTDGNGCSGKDSILVYVNNPPTIAFNSILPDCEGGISGSINVSATGSIPFSYQWSNGSNTQNLLNVSTGNYGVTVTDANGCSSGANFDLQDGEGDCLIVPTGFSPNGDNENDTWNIIGIEQFTKNQVQVFNRWGQTLFESKGTAVNWNGSYNDKLLPIADYYFVVDLGNGQVFNGTLTIKY